MESLALEKAGICREEFLRPARESMRKRESALAMESLFARRLESGGATSFGGRAPPARGFVLRLRRCAKDVVQSRNPKTRRMPYFIFALSNIY